MRRSGPLKAIFDPPIKYGSKSVTAQIGQAIGIGEPVLWYDTRDWTGGTMPATVGTTNTVGAIPNAGAAGSTYDLPVQVQYFRDLAGVGAHYLISGGLLDSTGAAPFDWNPPASLLTELGGPLALKPWVTVVVLGESDLISGTLPDGRVTSDANRFRISLGGFPIVRSGSTYSADLFTPITRSTSSLPLRVEQQNDLTRTSPAGPSESRTLDLRVASPVTNDDIDNTLFASSADPTTTAYTLAAYPETVTVTTNTETFSTFTVNTLDTVLTGSLPDVEIGWTNNWSQYVTPPNVGDPWRGIRGFALYREMPSVPQLANIGAAFGI